MAVKINLTGKVFSNLTVIKFDSDYSKGKKSRYWLCKCKCGRYRHVRTSKLTDGYTKSCGCKNYSTNRKHGLSKHNLYRVWYNMKSRCYKTKDINFHSYGGRGITVCKEWRNSLPVFYNWAIKNGYKQGLQLDRIDVNKGYTPDNCRFVTVDINLNNKRNSVYLKSNGRILTAAQWARELNVSANAIYSRIRRGWSDEKIITTNFKVNYLILYADLKNKYKTLKSENEALKKLLSKT